MELWLGGAVPTKAILMVSHNIEEAAFMADRLVIMDKGPGHIVAEVPVNLPHPRHRKERSFLQLVDQVYGLIAGKTSTEAEELGTAPGASRAGRGRCHMPRRMPFPACWNGSTRRPPTGSTSTNWPTI